MATTSNFGWNTPDDTDLVKDGALAIRTLGNNIDTSLVDLKGGTTGQILSKNSNTDLDYTWINNDQGDITEVQAGTGISVASGTGPVPVITNTVATEFDAKGDLVVGTGADTFDKLTAGNNGDTLLADSSTSTGLKWGKDPVADLVTTAGDTLYATAADTLARLGIGTAGQVLTVNSGATAPEWTSSSGGMTLISTTSMSGSSITLSSIPGTYKHLQVIVRNFKPATDDQSLRVRFNQDSSFNRHSSAANWGNELSAQSFGQTSFETVSASSDNSTANGLVIIDIPDYTNTTTWKILKSWSVATNATTTTQFNTNQRFFIYNQTSAITSLVFFPNSGNFTSGDILLYGVA